MSALTVESLNLHHGLLHAARDISLSVATGEVVAIVGANGAGKTTLLRAIAGAHRPSSGTIRFDGKDITDVPAHRRVGMGIALVPEGRRLFQQMSVEENLQLGRMSGRAGPWTVDKVIETFPNLEARRRARAGTLSGGEQQATAIGRALMSNPSLLLLDEVSLGLSPIAVDRVYQSLDGLMRSGVTIVLVEQDLSRAMRVASRVICVLEGRVVLEGPTATLQRERVTEAYFGLDHHQRVSA
jgi:branched-chain amino acid transport system ATP-binding protein